MSRTKQYVEDLDRFIALMERAANSTNGHVVLSEEEIIFLVKFRDGFNRPALVLEFMGRKIDVRI